MCGSTRPEVLDRLHDNDTSLTAELLHGPVEQRRNRIALDWDNAWRLDTGGSDRFDREVIDVSIRFAAERPREWFTSPSSASAIISPRKSRWR
jgi:Protein of unknown function (DUF1062)